MGKWMEKVSTIKHTEEMNAQEAIKQAHVGTLTQSVLIECKPEYATIWGGSPLWLCPDDDSKQHIQREYPADFALSATEFFEICEGILKGQDMRQAVHAMRLFSGSLEKGA